MFLEGVVLRMEEEIFLKGECSLGRFVLSWIQHVDVDVVGFWCGLVDEWVDELVFNSVYPQQ